MIKATVTAVAATAGVGASLKGISYHNNRAFIYFIERTALKGGHVEPGFLDQSHFSDAF
jgi:hypothetical protein